MTAMTREELEARLAALETENKNLKTKGPALKMKVGQKGGASLYGLGRFPVTLYKDQWKALLGYTDSIRAFLEDNDELMTEKE